MPFKISVISPPGSLPVSVSDMRLYLKIDDSADDAVIDSLIQAATDAVEKYTGLALITRGCRAYLDAWPTDGTQKWWDGLREGADIRSAKTDVALPCPPLQSVQSVTQFMDDDTFSEYDAGNYYADALSFPGRIVIKNGAPPQGTRAANAIAVDFTAGYGDEADDVPAPIRQAIRLIAAYLYDNRAGGLGHPLDAPGASALLQPYRQMSIA